MAYRVLLVDDYEPWRKLVGAKLERNLQWDIVGEAADGLEAVNKSEALLPDLILLDIGLPKLSGLEAARRIRATNPDIKILFLSENLSSDIAQVALEIGHGYVLKSNAVRELLPAMEALVEDLATGEPPRHEIAFYSDDATLIEGYGRYAEEALNSGKALIVVSRDIPREVLEQELTSRGMDVQRLTSEGVFRWLDANDVLSSFVVENWPDEERFWNVVPPIIKEAARASTAKHARVAAWGECAPILWKAGNAEAAIKLEQLWNDISRIHGLDVFCAYPAKSVSEPGNDSFYERISREHSLVHL